VALPEVAPGERADLRLKVSETYTAAPVDVPVTVIRGVTAGPAAFVTGALHGDELNGVAVVHDLLYEVDLHDLAGTLVLVPVVNVLGVTARSRYLPDRRDLNRHFPGNPNGSAAARYADAVFRTVVEPCDFGIDLHTATVRRANAVQVRGDFRADARLARLARASGLPFVVQARRRRGSLRWAAQRRGIACLVFEGGEPLRFERSVVAMVLDGVLNVLAAAGMLPGRAARPPDHQVVCPGSRWLRAEVGGILDTKVRLGQHVTAGDELWSTINVFGRERNSVSAPTDGWVIGMTTLPMVQPGDPVLHLGLPAD
jgi:predicted deacylase